MNTLILTMKGCKGGSRELGGGEEKAEATPRLRPVKTPQESSDWVSDVSCPHGWMSKTGGTGGFYKGRSFREPSGKVHSGLLDALRSLARTDRKEELEVLRENLELEGWTNKESLPKGWMFKDKIDNKGKSRPS